MKMILAFTLKELKLMQKKKWFFYKKMYILLYQKLFQNFCFHDILKRNSTN